MLGVALGLGLGVLVGAGLLLAGDCSSGGCSGSDAGWGLGGNWAGDEAGGLTE